MAAATRDGQHSRDVILTFANLGYADFVLNGFSRAAVRAHTLVVALDEDAHALFVREGMHSYYAPCMPTISSAAASTGSLADAACAASAASNASCSPVAIACCSDVSAAAASCAALAPTTALASAAALLGASAAGCCTASRTPE